jgi:hypothetical protein
VPRDRAPGRSPRPDSRPSRIANDALSDSRSPDARGGVTQRVTRCRGTRAVRPHRDICFPLASGQRRPGLILLAAHRSTD